MGLSSEFLNNCEQLIAKGETEAVLQQILTITEKTGYKSEILMLSNRWEQFSRDQLAGILNQTDQQLQKSKFSNDLLILIKALRNELENGAINSNLFETKEIGSNKKRLLLSTYFPMFLTALAVWGICFLVFFEEPKICENEFNLGGVWSAYANSKEAGIKVGEIKVDQDSCCNSFVLEGAFRSLEDKTKEINFDSKIGGINDGFLYFIYESHKERGIETGLCEGKIPITSQDTFTVHCYLAIGLDSIESRDKGKLKFVRNKPTE